MFITIKITRDHLLNRCQLVESKSEGIDRVIDEGGGGVKMALGNDVIVHPDLSVNHVLNYSVNNIFHLRIV